MNEPLNESPRRIHHIAVAVRDLEAALGFWRDALGLPVEKRAVLPDQGVEVALLSLANSRIELVQPLDVSNSVGHFIERRGEALHHVCFTTSDIEAEMASMRGRGVELIDDAPRQGIMGRVCFIHPWAHHGVLLELVEAPEEVEGLGVVVPRPERRGIGAGENLPTLAGFTACVVDVGAALEAWRHGLGLVFETRKAVTRAEVGGIGFSLEACSAETTAGLDAIELASNDAGKSAAEWPSYVIRAGIVEPTPVRVLIAKPGLDGHDRGARVVARALREAGMDVAYTGIRQTPEAIAEAAAQQQVDVLGISILSGAHLSLLPRIIEALLAQGVALEDLLIVAGGIIPVEDIPALRELGVAAVFGPGTKTGDIVAYIRENIRAQK